MARYEKLSQNKSCCEAMLERLAKGGLAFSECEDWIPYSIPCIIAALAGDRLRYRKSELAREFLILTLFQA